VALPRFHGNLFDTAGRVESFSFLYLNPPYDSEIGSMGNKRMEYLFLEHTFRWLVEGGVLLMVVPQERLVLTIPLLAGNFADVQLFRLTDPEAQRFDQVALFGVRKRMRGEHYDRNRKKLLQLVWNRSMPTVTGNESPYPVPPAKPVPLVYRGLPLDRIEDLLVGSGVWRQVEPFLLPKEEITGGRPITPLHAGHVGLLCTAGLLNGVFGEGSERHIARWRTVKTVTVFEVADPRWGDVVLGRMRRDKLIRRLDGIRCNPAVIQGTREDLMERISEARRAGLLSFPESNGPILWPRFSLHETWAMTPEKAA
jgi:hypothetical protein